MKYSQSSLSHQKCGFTYKWDNTKSQTSNENNNCDKKFTKTDYFEFEGFILTKLQKLEKLVKQMKDDSIQRQKVISSQKFISSNTPRYNSYFNQYEPYYGQSNTTKNNFKNHFRNNTLKLSNAFDEESKSIQKMISSIKLRCPSKEYNSKEFKINQQYLSPQNKINRTFHQERKNKNSINNNTEPISPHYYQKKIQTFISTTPEFSMNSPSTTKKNTFFKGSIKDQLKKPLKIITERKQQIYQEIENYQNRLSSFSKNQNENNIKSYLNGENNKQLKNNYKFMKPLSNSNYQS